MGSESGVHGDLSLGFMGTGVWVSWRLKSGVHGLESGVHGDWSPVSLC